ncbi:hypothetical protein EDB85DRAFT_56043 [Lactarius pseudohatsudake]|nr:hypothetical protein EDB85DRAFT_56043 [Lactarius pseudohatsudake]
MNISIDDLVSSFSASHVSQEAMDIATLQSQLAKVIYYPSQGQPGVHSVSRRNSYAQPCTTPTPTSATASFHWEWEDTSRFRGQNSTPYAARSYDGDDEMADEQAVEDLLNVHTPMQSQPGTPQRQQPPKYRPSVQFSSYDNTSQSSHFANTDPFYLAAVQTAAIPPPPSFFAQAARLGPNSPFNLSLSAQQAHHTLEVESRTVLVGAGQGR